ncbi:MAG: TIGR02757 family protein [Nitrospirae bacterium]|nr:TIGR02757 family protein [Nitrospirota bacterium]
MLLAPRLKELLDSLYDSYDFAARIDHDPIGLVHRYSSPADIEVAGLIAASMAYGKVTLFKPVIERILAVMGCSPADYAASFEIDRDKKRFDGIKYRFTKPDDIVSLLAAVNSVMSEYGSLKNLFMAGLSENDADIGKSLAFAINRLRRVEKTGSGAPPSHGLLHLLPTPASGGAAKRIALYLRWMVRDKDIDFGVWREIGSHRLVIPLDTHIARISRCIGLTGRTSRDWKTAAEITGALKAFSPDDPLRYDFALCHQGISGQCPARKDMELCRNCLFTE